MSWKRTLFLFNRWAGIVLCLCFALWFLSGILMMYVEFPQLTRAERLAGAAPLDFADAALAPGDALGKVQPGDFIWRGTPSGFDPVAPDDRVTARSLRLAMITSRPAYIIHPENGAQPRVVFADTGAVLREVTTPMGLAAAADFQRRLDGATDASKPIRFQGSVQTDQWSLSGEMNDHVRYSGML